MHRQMNAQQKAQHISRCLQLAIALEVSVPKPGNVSPTANFEGTRAEHFLASAIAAGPCFEAAAYRGAAVGDCKLALDKVGVGELIKCCVSDVMSWQRGGNTILGTVMLMVPLAVAAGMSPTKKGEEPDFAALRGNLDSVVRATSALDAVHLYEAVDLAVPNGLGDASELDLKDPASKQKLLKDDVSLFRVFEIAAGYDDICYEWVHNYSVTFNAYIYLRKQLKQKPLEVAVTNVFLKILSKRPDTFIARKMGKPRAIEVSKQAKTVLKLGALETEAGKAALAEFDAKLRKEGNRCNPGTTADLVAATLALCVLDGFRP